ncbi:hypothetical protein [Microbacterium sp. VKM Ac-2923]|uniref:hypothetical protein n=1 Tax=Microbacterium sp. VKM Ac-2923 TaxID=2929476 RepID=UPI001FB314AF|nr:hypothetical protein [Microbacterium sp. VKM Ac-2923]MCJ1709151.1 hypothetical protein [Microbacterium sp. VKM Ac-2923]
MSELRNLGYDDLLNCFMVGPLVGLTPERALSALEDVVRSPRGATLLRVRTRGRRWRRVDQRTALAAAGRSVERVEAALDRSAVTTHVLERQFQPGELPVRLFVADGMLAMGFPHSLFDGTGATAVVNLVLEKLGAPGADTRAALPWAKTPLRAALKKFGLQGVAGIRSARETFRTLNAQTETGYQLPRTLTKAESIERTRMVSMVLSADAVRAIANTPEKADDGRRPARPPLSVKSASLVLRCLRDSLREETDFRVVVPVDARRWVAKGFAVEGNFAPSLPMGRLRVDDWSATALAERISAVSKAGTPVAWLLATALSTLKNTVRHPVAARRSRGVTPRVPLEIHVSLTTTEVAVSETLMPRVEDDTFVGGMAAHLRLPLGVWAEIAPVRGCLHVVVRDETGLFDLEGFEQRLRAMIASAPEAGDGPVPRVGDVASSAAADHPRRGARHVGSPTRPTVRSNA